MNYRAAARFMNMIRRQIIGYMCHFTEKDLRTTMARTMTELVWQALKDSRDLTNQTCLVTFDKEGLDLAFKYFTCSMLTLRLAGIAQINVSLFKFHSSYIKYQLKEHQQRLRNKFRHCLNLCMLLFICLNIE